MAKCNYKTDAKNYAGSDSGCKQATDYLLGRQSSCQHCPFTKCAYDEPRVGVEKRTRDEEIIQRFYKGESIADLATALGVCERTIQRAVKKYRVL